MRECLGPSCPNIRRIGALAKKYREVRRKNNVISINYAKRMEKVCSITPEVIAKSIASIVCSRCPGCTPRNRKRCWALYAKEAQAIYAMIVEALMWKEE